LNEVAEDIDLLFQDFWPKTGHTMLPHLDIADPENVAVIENGKLHKFGNASIFKP